MVTLGFIMASTVINVEQAFYTGDYNAVIESKIEDSDRVRELQARAFILSDRISEALELISQKATSVNEALRFFAENKVENVHMLLTSDSDSATRHIVALALARAGEYDHALEVLAKCTNNLDAVYLKVHIYLLQNNVKAAQGEIDAARSWANDHIIFNIAEALLCLRNNSAQKAFFIYEENNSLVPTAASSLGEMVAQTLLHRFPEAEQAKAQLAENTDEAVAVSSLALDLIQGKSAESDEARTLLRKSQYTNSALVNDMKEKERLFDEAVAKFNK